MKYRVSLLPENVRKRLDGRKRIEKIQIYALVVLVILALFLMIVSFTRMYANEKLGEVRMLDNEYAQKVAELEQFREINANLQEKVKLIEGIQVEEPQLVNFLAKISNLKAPGISIENIECTDWKITRACVLTGTCDNREQYLAFEKTLSEMEEISGVACVNYTAGVDTRVQFTISINCKGGAAPIVTTTEAVTNENGEVVETTGGETTAEATDVAAE